MQLLDTCVLIELSGVVLPDDQNVFSTISEAELLFGIEKATDPVRKRELHTRYARLSTAISANWLPFDSPAARGYGLLAGIVARSRPSHSRSKDIMLAGHAYSLGARLVTLNPRDFDLVADHVEIVVPERIR